MAEPVDARDLKSVPTVDFIEKRRTTGVVDSIETDGKQAELHNEYRVYVDRCNRITDRDIEDAEFQRFIAAQRRAST